MDNKMKEKQKRLEEIHKNIKNYIRGQHILRGPDCVLVPLDLLKCKFNISANQKTFYINNSVILKHTDRESQVERQRQF